MKLATWNVNSINARLNNVLDWFREAQPDVACLQEIKCVDEAFPAEPFESMGYNVIVHGQKTYNGDDNARYIEALVLSPRPVRVGGLYLPNGNPIGTEKFAYKLNWMARLNRHARALLALEEPLVLMGDYNVIPGPDDADKPETWAGDALYQPESRAAYRALQYLGLTDAYMAADGRPGGYTFWDYQAGAWQRNHGIRIDHALLSPQAADRLRGVEIHRETRDREKPSDHVPVVVELAP